MSTLVAPPSTRRGTRRNPWVDTVTQAWRAANDAWEAEREAVAIGYATEMAEFAALKPRPRLKDFMVHMAHDKENQ